MMQDGNTFIVFQEVVKLVRFLHITAAPSLVRCLQTA